MLRSRLPLSSLRRVRLFALAVLLTLTASSSTSTASADGLTGSETARLARGETVVREQDLVRGDRQYVGGVTYTLIDAAPSELASLLEDVDMYKKVLPRTKKARLVAKEGADRVIELVHGNAMMEAEYAILVRRESKGEYRFWMDVTRKHEIDDCWGFFRLEPMQGAKGEARVLLTYGVLVDVGPGIVRELFEEKVRAALLGVPQSVRRHVADRRSIN